MIVLSLFQFDTRLNSQNPYEPEIYNELRHLKSIRIPAFSICIFEVSTPRNWCFCLYFSLIHDYWPSITRNSSVYYFWNELERCEKVLFSFSKREKWIFAET